MDSTALAGVAVALVVIIISFVFMRSGSKPKAPVGAAAAAGGAAAGSAASATKSAAAATAAKAPSAAPAGPLHVYFGSQTGTSEGYAEQLKKEASGHGFSPTVVDLDDFDAEQLKTCEVAIFVLATYGEGEPTDNAAAFYKYLKDAVKDGEEAGQLKGLKFTVFGLGNRQYEHYNKVSRTADAWLEKLGATRIFELGAGDDDGDMDEDFEGWRERLWPELLVALHPDFKGDAGSGGNRGRSRTSSMNNKSPSAADLEALATLAVPPLPFSLSTAKPPAAAAAGLAATTAGWNVGTLDATAPPQNAQSSTKHFFTATRVKVVVNEELRTPADGGSTRHVEVDIHGTGLSYDTADNLAVRTRHGEGGVTHAQRGKGGGATLRAVWCSLLSHASAPFTPDWSFLLRCCRRTTRRRWLRWRPAWGGATWRR